MAAHHLRPSTPFPSHVASPDLTRTRLGLIICMRPHRSWLLALITLLGLPPGSRGQEGPQPWWSVLDTLPEGVHFIRLDSLYRVQGSTAREIALQLAELGPRRDGRSFHGFHEAPWRWSYRTDGLPDGRCRLAEFKLVARSVITLPRLAGEPPVPRDLRAAWDSYLASLRAHEEGHRAIALRVLRRFGRRAAAVRPRACDDFQGFFESMTEEAEAELRSSQDAYDRDTDFGRTQGAVWPPPSVIMAAHPTHAGGETGTEWTGRSIPETAGREEP